MPYHKSETTIKCLISAP